MRLKIHFENQPFLAIVPEKGESPILCTPVVYDEKFCFGTAILYKDGGGKAWGLIAPRDIIAAWRGTEVLRLLERIEDETLTSVYYTGFRNPDQFDFKRYVIPMIKEIGQESYNKIMSMKVPEQIIRAILDNQDGDTLSPDTYPITLELRAGTIEWRKEFADYNISK